MCDRLAENGILTKRDVLAAFRLVPRAFFVPAEALALAYIDAPLREGPVHLSAPHIYGAVLDALELKPGASFLNVGSGTGCVQE